MFTALEKLYGLKLHDGVIVVENIPDKFKEKAIAYSETLKEKSDEE